MRRIDARRGTENFKALFPTEFELLTKNHQGGPKGPPIRSRVKRIESMFYKFLWNEKPDLIKKTKIIQDYASDGLQMVDLTSFIQSLKLSCLKRLINKTTAWTTIAKQEHIDPYKLFKCVSCFDCSPRWTAPAPGHANCQTRSVLGSDGGRRRPERSLPQATLGPAYQPAQGRTQVGERGGGTRR